MPQRRAKAAPPICSRDHLHTACALMPAAVPPPTQPAVCHCRFWEERVATLERQIDHYRAVTAARRAGGGAFPELALPPGADAAIAAGTGPQPVVTKLEIPIDVPTFLTHAAEARASSAFIHFAAQRPASSARQC